MKYLFIDTCIYVQCCLLEIEGDDIGALKRVRDLLNQQEVKLLLPEVVELEFYKILNNKLRDLKEKIGHYQENINKDGELDKKIKSDLITKIKEVIGERTVNTEKAKKEIEVLFNSADTLKLAIKGDHLVSAYKEFLSSLKPYKPNQRGEMQPDCLIISSLSEYLMSKGSCDFYFCSSNTEDFSTTDKDKSIIHPEISKRFKSVVFYSNLYDLLNKEFGANYSEKSIEKLEEKRIEADILVDDPESIPNNGFSTSISDNFLNEGSKRLVDVFWPLVIENIRKKNSTIAALLRDCKVSNCKNKVKIFTRFKFHYDKLCSNEVDRLLEDCLMELINRDYDVTIYPPAYYNQILR